MSSSSPLQELRKQIDLESAAYRAGLSGIALGTAMHTFINNRMQRIQEFQEELVPHVGHEEALALVLDLLIKDASIKD